MSQALLIGADIVQVSLNLLIYQKKKTNFEILCKLPKVT